MCFVFVSLDFCRHQLCFGGNQDFLFPDFSFRELYVVGVPVSPEMRHLIPRSSAFKRPCFTGLSWAQRRAIFKKPANILQCFNFLRRIMKSISSGRRDASPERDKM